MAFRAATTARLPITAALAGKRTPMLASRFTARFNSTSSAASGSSQAAQVVEMARTRAAGKPSPLEMSIPVMWLLCGVAGWTAWQRAEARGEESAVEKLIIV